MPLPSRAEHEVVARGAPRRLLGDLDVGHAVLGEEALLLGDEQRRRVGQRDEAELGALSPPGRRPARHARRREIAPCAAPSSAAVPALAFRNVAAADARACCVRSSVVIGLSSSLVRMLIADASVARRSRPTKKAAAWRRAMRLPRTAALLVGPSLDLSRASPGVVGIVQFKFRAKSGSIGIVMQINAIAGMAIVAAARAGARNALAARSARFFVQCKK